MGVRITDTDTVALYDSVSGFAFGPTFDSEEDAQNFLDMTTALGTEDPRSLTDDVIGELHTQWYRATEAGEGTVTHNAHDVTLTDGEWAHHCEGEDADNA